MADIKTHLIILKTFYLKIKPLFPLFSLIISLGAVYYTYESNIMVHESNQIATDANNISNEVKNHQLNIEISRVNIGEPRATDKNISGIAIPLVNGNYANFPAQITSVELFLNEKKIENDEGYGIDYGTVDKDKTKYVLIIFNKSFNFESKYDNTNSIKYYSNIDKFKSKSLIVKVFYSGFTEDYKYMSVRSFDITISDKNELIFPQQIERFVYYGYKIDGGIILWVVSKVNI